MKSAAKNSRRFASRYLALLRDLYRFRPGWTLAIVFFQILGPILTPLIVVVLSQGVGLIQGKELAAGGLPERYLGAMEPVEILAALSGVIIVLGILGALLAWLGTSGARRLGRHYRLHLAESLLHRIASSPLGSIRLPARFADEQHLHNVTVAYGLKLNLAIICLFVAIRHGAATIALAACLVYVDTKLSGIFFLALPVVLPLYYILHMRTHRASRSWFMEGGAKQTSGKLLDLGREANALPASRAEAKETDFREALRANSLILDNLETMEYGRLSGARSQLYSQSFRALFIGGALFLFGLAALRPGELAWDSLLVFLVAASMLQQSASGFFSAVSTLVWYSPPVGAIQSYAKAAGSNRGGRRSKLTQEPDGDAKKARVVLVVSDVAIGRTSFHFIFSRLHQLGVVGKGPSDLEFQSVALRRMTPKEQLEHLSHYSPEADVTLLDPGRKNQADKLALVRNAGFKRCLVFVDGWEDDLAMIDYIVKIGEDGTIESGPPSHWEGRDDLAKSRRSGGGDFDLDEMI